MLVLRVLVHHRLGVASTRRAAVGLVRKLVLLVGRAVLWLMRLRVGAPHGCHFAWISTKPMRLCELPTRSWRHLVHLWALCARLHVHHRRLLMALLRSLVAHHRRSGARAGETIGTSWHVAGVLRVSRLGVHLHLGLAGHAHERPVRGILLHHVAAHLRSGAINELSLRTSKWYMLHARAHAVLLGDLHLLWVARHWLGLSIHVWRDLARRRLDGRGRVRELHVRGFEMGRTLSRMRLHVRASWCVLRSVLHALRALQMRRKLVLVRHGAVGHAVVRSQHLWRRCELEQVLVALVLIRLWEVPRGRRAMRKWNAGVVLLVPLGR